MALHILLVTNEFPPEKIAGTALSTRFLAEELALRGHRVTVVVNDRRSAPAFDQHARLEVRRLRPVPVRLTRMAQRAVALTFIASRRRPHIIQGQSISCGALAVAAGAALGIPAVTYVQGLDLYEAGRWARRTYVPWTLRLSRAVIAVTDDLRVRVTQMVGRSVTVIPHGLRRHETHRLTREAARASLGVAPSVPLLLYVGRLTPVKGVRYLLAATPTILARRPDAHIVIAGDGEEGPALRSLARDLGIADRVRFAGVLAHEHVIRFMRAADILAVPSVKEAFGMVLVEAMSCGLPIVASEVMGIPSLISDGINGRLVPPADPQALAGAILHLLDDPSRRERIAVRNLQRAEDFALPKIADAFMGVWSSVAGAGMSTRLDPAEREWFR